MPTASDDGPANTLRRRLLNWFLGSTFGGILATLGYPILRFLAPPEVAEASTNQVDAGPVDDPELVERHFKIVAFGNEPVIVVKHEDRFVAFEATCTHLDCIVEFRPDLGLIWCNCHNGRFDLSGQVVAGPPPRGLRSYAVHEVESQSGRAPTLVVERV
ncbi:MAG: ubiquinol-cytochrome c reductase iron-sulfur subunit [Thermoanaerobaculia bacterium]|nr:ubiquinol-cytochrome c reductase iron-sulfur subunit [Thermoanaerobaculia bacterium]